jgi:hypothetical protein
MLTLTLGFVLGSPVAMAADPNTLSGFWIPANSDGCGNPAEMDREVQFVRMSNFPDWEYVGIYRRIDSEMVSLGFNMGEIGYHANWDEARQVYTGEVLWRTSVGGSVVATWVPDNDITISVWPEYAGPISTSVAVPYSYSDTESDECSNEMIRVLPSIQTRLTEAPADRILAGTYTSSINSLNCLDIEVEYEYGNFTDENSQPWSYRLVFTALDELTPSYYSELGFQEGDVVGYANYAGAYGTYYGRVMWRKNSGDTLFWKSDNVITVTDGTPIQLSDTSSDSRCMNSLERP